MQMPPELLEWIGKGSVLMLLAYGWWDERQQKIAILVDLKAAQAENKVIAREATETMASMKTTLELLSRILQVAGKVK